MAEVPYSRSPFAKHRAAQRTPAPASKAGGKANPAEIAQLLQQGMAFQLKGNIGLAAEAYHRVLSLHPNHPDALHFLGMAAVSARQSHSAIDLFRRALAGKPSDPAIHLNLAQALLEDDDPTSAEVHVRKALKLRQDYPGVQSLLAECRAMAGANDEAKKLFAEALAQSPNDPRALIGYANLCMVMGEVEAAKAAYHRAAQLPQSAPPALARLAAIETPARGSPVARQIADLLAQPGLAPTNHRNLSYAAARIAGAAGDHDEAFQRFSDAKRSGAGSFDMAAHSAELAATKDLFTKAFFEARPKHGSPSRRPVFIVGMPRSGTTLAEQILSRHADVAAGGELSAIPRMAASLGFGVGADPMVFAKRVSRLAPSEAKALAGRYLAEFDRISPSAKRVTDKMPGNFMHLWLIALIFPDARVIHCRRDPLDTCVSCFTNPLKDHIHGYAADLSTLGEYYREYAALMEHWREVLSLPIHDLDYERLIESPEEESRKLIDFIGLPWYAACLTPQESARPVYTISMTQVREPIHARSIGRWRNYDRHLAPLKAALGDLADPEEGRGPAR